MAAAAAAAPSAPKPKKTDEGPRKRKGLHEQIMDDWEDFADDERRHKKARKKKGAVDADDPDLAALDALDAPDEAGGGDLAKARSAHQSRKNARRQKGAAKMKHKAYAKKRLKGKRK